VTGPLDRVQLDAFRDVVAGRLGLQLDDGKLDLVADVLGERLAALGDPPLDAYLARLAAGDEAEVGALAERLTVGETYFFRNRNDLDAFLHAVIPARLEARARERRLRIVSAGCSSGEEPYTLAMLLLGVPALEGWDVRIQGFDVNPAAVARARAARYGEWSLRQTSAEARARFFRRERGGVRVADEVRALVELEERNLVAEDPRFWQPGTLDVVFCRNVTMYLSPEITRRIVARVARALAPGGVLFLGHAETLRGVSSAFHLRNTHGTFYYQLRGGAEEPLQPARAAPAPAAEPALAAPLPEGGWVEAIRRASERVAHLAAARPPGAPGAAPTPAPLPAPAPWRPAASPAAVASELLREERFAEALAALGAAPIERETDRDALLVRAVLLTVSGDPREAERVCARLLELDELNAEAHYVMALCREHARDPAGAASHDHYACYLDPTFAMPRLHLGLMASRAGEREGARRELARALVLLAAEEGSRILLLGGGFRREALVGLCSAELRACGGTP
jgi:chemotaxis protein methyltransferase CheR